MTYPLNLVIIRHGESEGNVANDFSRKGDNHCFTPEHLSRHSHWWRLSDRGITQVKLTGDWLRQNHFDHFDHYLTSTQARAIETAAYLNFTKSNWQLEYDWRERDAGDFDVMTEDERQLRYPEYFKLYERERFFLPHPNGESTADVTSRLQRRLIPLLSQTWTNKNVIMVGHGDTIRALRIIIENIAPHVFNSLMTSKDPYLKTENCQIIHYTRINPANLKDVRAEPTWVRSLCPSNPKTPHYDWKEIVRTKYTNDELMQIVQPYHRLVA